MDPDLTIVLLGNSGVGKSASGNTILGKNAFESKNSFQPVTKVICRETAELFGKQILVIDTPDIFDAEAQITSLCQELLQASTPCLFLLVFSVGSFTKWQNKAVKKTVRILGPEQVKDCYLLFTGGDILSDTSLEEFVFEDATQSLPGYIKRFSRKCHLFNNEAAGQEQVRELLVKTAHLEGQEKPTAVFPDRRIVLLGLPGVGKSATGNTILKTNHFLSSCDFNVISNKCVSKSSTVEGRQVTVVDTPAFSGDDLSSLDLYKEIMKITVEASPGPHAFVIVVKVGEVSKADIGLLEVLPKLFGSDTSKHVVVLLTHGDKLEGRPVEDLIRPNSRVSNLISACEDRYCVFDNKRRGDRLQVQKLLEQLDDISSRSGQEYFTSEWFERARVLMEDAEKMQTDQTAGAQQTAKETAWREMLPAVVKQWETFRRDVQAEAHGENEFSSEMSPQDGETLL